MQKHSIPPLSHPENRNNSTPKYPGKFTGGSNYKYMEVCKEFQISSKETKYTFQTVYVLLLGVIVSTSVFYSK